MFPVISHLVIGQIGTQILASPAGLDVLLKQPGFDPIASMRAVDTVVIQLYGNLGKKGSGLKMALATLDMLTPASDASVVWVTMGVLADFLKELNKGDFERAASRVREAHGSAFFWSSKNPLSVVRRRITPHGPTSAKKAGR